MPRPAFTPYQMVPLLSPVRTNMQLIPAGTLVQVEGYWDELTGKSWGESTGNPACLVYAARGAVVDLPDDDDVVYVKHENLGSLVHVTELDFTNATP